MMKKVFFALFALLFCNLLAKAEISLNNNPEAVKALAKCLQENNATMYGAKNCGHCNAQKDMFGPYFKYVRFVDCRASSTDAKECNQQKVGKFPQWNFANGQKIVREANLEQIAHKANCEAYISAALGNTNYISENNNAESAAASAKVSKVNNTNNSSNNSNSFYGSPEDLAKCLKAKGVKFYGSPKCSHCNKQKEMFEGAFEKYLSSNFHNCKGSASEQAECYKLNTFPFPSWVEPSTGKKLLGPEKSLTQIAKTFDCTLASNNSSSSDNLSSSNNSSSKNLADEYKVELTKNPNNSFQTNSNYPTEDKVVLEQKQNKLAQCLIERNIILYGITDSNKGKAAQYNATQDQLQELGAAAKQIKIVDCSSGQAECSGILVYPTWILDNKNELAGVYELNNLAQILSCPLE